MKNKLNDILYIKINIFFGQQMNYRSELSNNIEKQRLSDTYLTFLPKNTSGYTYVNQLIEIQIPKSQHVINLAQSYIHSELQIPLKLSAAYSEKVGSRFFVGLQNAACMFDQIQILSNNKSILSDTYSQVSSRIWQMSKSDHYLKANYHSFVNIDDINLNNGFLVKEIKDLTTTYQKIIFKTKIPLPCLFNCFDNCEHFLTTLLNDNVTLSMQLSSPEKFLCLFETDKNGKVLNVQPFNTDNTIEYNGSTNKVEFDPRESQGYQIMEGFKIITPGHYPTEEELIDIQNVVANGAWFREFTNCSIQSQDADFGPTTSGLAIQTSINFNTNVSNIYNIMILSSHNHSYTIFDKPAISDIELNASEIWKLANNHTHTDSTYLGDNDMYLDLLNGFGSQTFKNLNRFDSAITHDYNYKGDENLLSGRVYGKKLLGSYIQFYRFAPSGQMGYSGAYFANQINYKFKNDYKRDIFGTLLTENNYANSTVFCCVQTLSFLVFKEGGLDIINPNSNEIDVKSMFSSTYNNYSGNGHGLPAIIPALTKPISNLFGGLIGNLRKSVKESRGFANRTYAYSQLGKDGYEKHREIIESNSPMRKRKFKKFINGLKQLESQIKPSHGIDDSVGLSGENEEIAEPATFDELNLYPFVQSYSADIADYDYKNQLILDYKYGLNLDKLRLNSFGSEAAVAGNRYHGRVSNWFKKIGRKFVGWFKKDGKRILKDSANDMINIAREYAAKIATGELPLSEVRDLKPALRNRIMNILRNNTRDSKIGGLTGEAIDYYKKYKSGEMKWNDIPRDMISRIKELDLNEKRSGEHGLIVRHGFVPGPRIRPGQLYSVQKQRIKRLLDKNPNELRRKDLRRLYRFKYLKNNGVIDTSHGRIQDILMKYQLYNAKPGYRDPVDRLKEMDLIKKTSNNHGNNKWKNIKAKLLETDKGIEYLQKLKNKSKLYKFDKNTGMKWKKKKAKKFLKSMS